MRDLINWHDHFYYESDTGKIRWKYSPRHSINAGDEAGSPSKRGYICIVVRGATSVSSSEGLVTGLIVSRGRCITMTV